MSVIHTPRKPELDLRMVAFPVLMVVALSVLFFRLWYFQVVEAPVLVERAQASRIVPMTKPAPRGLIFDRNAVPLATVRPQIVVTAVPNDVKNHPWVLDRVAALLGTPVERLERKLKDAAWKPYLPSPIYAGASIETGAKIAETADELPGIGVETEPMRFYPDSTSFTHVLGYVWVPSDTYVKSLAKSGRSAPEYVGKTGLERAFDLDLMGSSGDEKVALDAQRKKVRVEGREAATPGNQLVLTLDAKLQQFAAQDFKDKGLVGGAVAIDPRTGEILCMTSSPSFDESLFKGGISDEEWKQLNSDPKKPQLDRAISGSYPPGSTFKIVTTVAAARTGKFSKDTVFYCPGGFFRQGVKLKCLGYHGSIDFEQAFARSCNTYFCNLGTLVGEDAIRQTALDMGLGERTGLEIGGHTESPGVVPTLDWLQRVSHRKKPHWYLGDTANLSVGQGYLQTTPIQMANVAAMVANDGVSYRPHLVREVKDPNGHEVRRYDPEILHKIDLPASFWAELRHAMVGVIDDPKGTAVDARIQGVTWGGKTGSAEHGKKSDKETTHAWFVGFAPADNPRIAVCVLAESAGHGAEVAPIARDIVLRYLRPPAAAKGSPKATP